VYCVQSRLLYLFPIPNLSELPMDSLPIELLVKVFEFLPMTTLATITPVNRRWRAVTTKLLYTIIEHPDWKPKRVSICLQALSSSLDGTLSTIVRHLDLSLWSTDPALSLLLVEALIQTKLVVKLRLTMSETFSQHFETYLLEYGIIASDSVGEGEPEWWLKQFLPHLEELEFSSGYKPFQLAAGRPVRCVSSPTHMQYHALQCLLPFLRRSRGPIQSVHFNLTGRDTNIASQALKMTARMLPYLTHVFFNFFVSKRAHV
jgi:F-box-like